MKTSGTGASRNKNIVLRPNSFTGNHAAILVVEYSDSSSSNNSRTYKHSQNHKSKSSKSITVLFFFISTEELTELSLLSKADIAWAFIFLNCRNSKYSCISISFTAMFTSVCVLMKILSMPGIATELATFHWWIKNPWKFHIYVGRKKMVVEAKSCHMFE